MEKMIQSKICLQCGKEYFKKSNCSKNQWKDKKYCSYDCKKKAMTGQQPWNKGKKGLQVSWIKGKHHTEETRKKLSELNKNKKYPNRKKLSEENRKILSLSHIGIIPSIETRKKQSISHRGEKSHLWKGGITPENHKIRTSLEYKLFRKSCFERDNFTCQISGEHGGDLQVHHINNFADFPELRTSIENGITLSKKIHQEFHKIYGYKNNTKEQLEEFIINIYGQRNQD